ncbi:MAG: acyltransferase [[Clostridium] fimetarium]|nr:acyltransferase [[Clostridium] fimetarium]
MPISPLNRKQDICAIAKYIAALLVVNGHMFLFNGGPAEMTGFMNLGACCVGLFFFFSGYGLTYSYRTKGDAYLKNFFRKRYIRLLIPLVTAYLITLPIYAVCKGPIKAETLATTLIWGGPYLKFSWYVSEIAVVYLLFFIAMKIGSTYRLKLLILTTLIVALTLGLLITRQPLWYAVSLPGLIIGIWYGEYETRIISQITTKRLRLLTFGFASLWIFFWQWSILGAPILAAYRYAFAASFLSVIFFALTAICLLLCVKASSRVVKLIASGGGNSLIL